MMLTDISPQSFGRNGAWLEWSRERVEQRDKRVYGVQGCMGTVCRQWTGDDDGGEN
jgi:hypothetical protein